MAIKNLKINKLKCIFLLKEITASPPILNKQKITTDINELNIGKEYKPYIKRFINKTSIDFNFRYPNEKLVTLKIKKHSNSDYLIRKNKIRLKKKKDIYHELFHVFTLYKMDSNHIFSGFNQYGLLYDIANSFDEGYTDLLSERYFDDEILYMIEANIVSKVELMLGKEKMRSMYTANDLMGLIKFLSKHSSKQEAIGFITMMDKLDNYDYESKEAINLMNILSNYLVNVYLNFLAENYSLGIIDNADVNNELSKFKDKFVKYAFNDKELKKEYLRSSDYLDITSKLSNSNFREELRKKVLTK